MIFTPTRVGKGISPTHVLEVSAVYHPEKLYAFRMYAWHKGHHVVTDYVSARDLGHAQRMAAYVVRTLVRDVVPPSQFDGNAVTWEVVPLGPSTPVARAAWLALSSLELCNANFSIMKSRHPHRSVASRGLGASPSPFSLSPVEGLPVLNASALRLLVDQLSLVRHALAADLVCLPEDSEAHESVGEAKAALNEAERQLAEEAYRRA
jgi:hypothetical protein